MSRYLESKVNGEWKNVWKYGFGCQPSEMFRIAEELGVGEYHLVHIICYERDKNGNIKKDEDGNVVKYYEYKDPPHMTMRMA